MLRSALSKTVLTAAPRRAVPAFAPVVKRGYHEKVISHYEKPRNVRDAGPGLPRTTYLISALSQVGSLPKNAPDVGTGLVGAPAYVVFCFRYPTTLCG